MEYVWYLTVPIHFCDFFSDFLFDWLQTHVPLGSQMRTEAS
jgi:hypothetical protein